VTLKNLAISGLSFEREHGSSPHFANRERQKAHAVYNSAPTSFVHSYDHYACEFPIHRHYSAISVLDQPLVAPNTRIHHST
jgi:hypothetical protein